MMKKFLIVLSILFFSGSIWSQDEEEVTSDSIEVFVIDSYVTPEKPIKFVLSFFTNVACKSRIFLQDKYEFIISQEFKEDHKAEIDISQLQFDSSRVPLYIVVEDSLGNKNRSERFDVALPSDLKSDIKSSPNIFLMCCVGGVIFGLPSPTLVLWGGKSYFSLTKEIPILSFYRMNGKYPFGYIGAEYSYIFNAPNEFNSPRKSTFRAGYKHIFEIPHLEYISTGISMFTNFKGFNGISPELTIGLVKFYDVFTIFTKYRYNVKPTVKKSDFHEISIGLYSSFFSLNLSF